MGWGGGGHVCPTSVNKLGADIKLAGGGAHKNLCTEVCNKQAESRGRGGALYNLPLKAAAAAAFSEESRDAAPVGIQTLSLNKKRRFSCLKTLPTCFPADKTFRSVLYTHTLHRYSTPANGRINRCVFIQTRRLVLTEQCRCGYTDNEPH